MKNIILHISIILIFSCKHVNSESKGATIHINNDGLYFEKDSINSVKDKVFEEDCVFDQETQTDGFLKGIKELENYVWDSESKTASIQISDNEILKIYRGGCTHFVLSATYEIKNLNLSFPKDKEFVFSKVLWVSELLKEFDLIKIQDDLKFNNFTFENDHNSIFLDLKNKEESNITYSIWVNDHSEYSEISIIRDMN
ncbi:hypothetical protein VP395_14230 [Mariniflexile soesokkakense]|uniref:Lipoprotein n=1 Tax=Mariniflexile soesokkakense TaxID=1343160 RepID=A0ABV0ACT2_9FLAO